MEMILKLWTDRVWQAVQTRIILLLEDHSDQGLHCLQYRLHLLKAFLYDRTCLFKLLNDYSKFLGHPKFKKLLLVSSWFAHGKLTYVQKLESIHTLYGSETHLREVPIYVKSRIVTS